MTVDPPSVLDHELTEHVTEGLNHLTWLVKAHDRAFYVGEEDGSIFLEWTDGRWTLSIVCLGHHAFERESCPELYQLVDEAVHYYGHHTTLFPGGCQERHPL